MSTRPDYFEAVRGAASRLWNQLDADPVLAAPWHQLFRQVQSPRHVLSELLQNADDANATEAEVRIESDTFVFEHNGDDFTEEHFASLCRFGFSNKRCLHTIGFRGIGFKSTFSLGDVVCLRTPTLSVLFERSRFTEPKWDDGDLERCGRTQIRIRITDTQRLNEAQKNLHEWQNSPTSLLFFRTIRRFHIGQSEVSWKSIGPGPVAETEWFALNGDSETRFLVVRSEEQPFPPEVLAEIREERALNEDVLLPPCKVELVVGAKGRLYVVLPTEVATSLPYACNAPFIQDPARLKIKDPATSPTNRWLLRRCGILASGVMLKWLNSQSRETADRAAAYDLMPDIDRSDASLAGACATIAEEGFESGIEGQPIVLTNVGAVAAPNGSVVVPTPIAQIWPEDQVSALFDPNRRPLLSFDLSPANRQKLIHWGFIPEISHEQILRTLAERNPQKPPSWHQLVKLWAYVSRKLPFYSYNPHTLDLRIVPVQGKDTLQAARGVVRVGEKRVLQSEDDWNLVSAHLLVLSSDWPRFLADRRSTADTSSDAALAKELADAVAMFDRLKLKDASDASSVMERITASVFQTTLPTIQEYVRLAQIAAKLGATISDSFRFISEDRVPRLRSHGLVFDRGGRLGDLLSPQWRSQHVLHDLYSESFTSCTREEWNSWASSDRSGIYGFVPLCPKRQSFWGRDKICGEIQRRGSREVPAQPYVTYDYVLDDWDFAEEHWKHWEMLAANDDRIWLRLFEAIAAEPKHGRSDTRSASASQIATTRRAQKVTFQPIAASWIVRLRELPCLPDSHGRPRLPAELLRRTPETESLMDIEVFVDGRFDTPDLRDLLVLLGVRDKATSPDAFLQCLRSLASDSNPPAHEVEKWYRRLDLMIDKCSTDDAEKIKAAFANEQIILSHEGVWTNASGVFLRADDDAPGAPVIRSGVNELALWHKVGVSERPTADRAIAWLTTLRSGTVPDQADLRRVSALLARHPTRIWMECRCWLNLAGEWRQLDRLRFCVRPNGVGTFANLFDAVREETADFRMLTLDLATKAPFDALRELSTAIELRFSCSHLGPPESKAWMKQLGVELRRIILRDEAANQRVHRIAEDLAVSCWRTTACLETVPLIDGVPVGTQQHVDAIWRDGVMHVLAGLPLAKLACAVTCELARVAAVDEIEDAFKMCFERQPGFVTEYMEANYRLNVRPVIGPAGIHDIISNGGQCEESGPDVDREENNLVGGQSGRAAEMAPPRSTQQCFDEVRGSDSGIDNGSSAGGADDFRHPECGFDDRSDLGSLERSSQSRSAGSPQAAQPPGPSIVESFALSRGFARRGDGMFYRPDGSRICHAPGAFFPWELLSPAGDVVRYLWAKDHCIEREPLGIEAEVWGLLDQSPERHGLILSDPDGKGVEYAGTLLRSLRADGRLKLNTASYRLTLCAPVERV